MTKIIESSDGFCFEIDDRLDRDEDGAGFRPASGRSGDRSAKKVIEKAFRSVLEHQIRENAKTVVETLRDVGADRIDLEFGVKITSSLDAVFARGGADAHMTIKLSFTPPKAAGTPS